MKWNVLIFCSFGGTLGSEISSEFFTLPLRKPLYSGIRTDGGVDGRRAVSPVDYSHSPFHFYAYWFHYSFPVNSKGSYFYFISSDEFVTKATEIFLANSVDFLVNFPQLFVTEIFLVKSVDFIAILST